MKRSSICGLTALALAACGPLPDALSPAGPQAERLATVFWIFTGVCGVVWVVVMVILALALRRRRIGEDSGPRLVSETDDTPMIRAIAVGAAATAVTVVALTIVSFLYHRTIADAAEADLVIEVTGHQWWWEYRYTDTEPHRVLTTANELHIPIGKRIKLRMTSSDVIHSFWVPRLMGMQDLITGRKTELDFVATEPGVFLGRCNEFCGLQHTLMQIVVIAHPEQDFIAWREQQLAPAPAPTDESRISGQRVFMGKACASCHTIRGTPTAGNIAPDLTHFASRRTIAAGALEMNRGNLAAWIADPQGVKPGVNMPVVPLSSSEFNDLLDYLEGLK